MAPRMRLTCAVLAALALFAASAVPGQAAGQAPPGPAASEAGLGLTTLGRQGWTVQSTRAVSATGDRVSRPGFPTAGWLPVRPDDAGAPGTEVEAMLQNGVCPHDPSFAIDQHVPVDDHGVFFSDNLQRCFGRMDVVGPDTIPEFQVPWWFRTDFTADPRPDQAESIVVNGVVGQADVWLNGTEIGTQTTVRGSFTSVELDVTGLLRSGVNSLALELFPNDSTLMLTMDTVDWNQIAPDNSTGIQFPVQLHVSRALAIGDAHVTQDDAPDLSSAALTVSAAVTNHAADARTGVVTAAITPPGGGPAIRVSRPVTVAAGSTRTVTFTPAAFPQLTLRHPAVWWPYQMGGQPLYRLDAAVALDGASSDAAPPVTFGVRTVTTFLTAPSSLAPQGVRWFTVNGRVIVFRAGGFVEDLFLHYSSSDVASQVALIRSMGLNGIRTEGKEVPGDFYEQMDRAGILVDAGFQCCDSWQPDGGGQGVTARDFQVMEESSLAIGRRLRDHPGIMDYSWSDSPPIPEQEAASLAGFAEAGFQEPIVSSAESLRSGILGPSGEREGPYDWVPPTYWYDTTHTSANAVDDDPAMTNVGGSWGFDSEQSAGDTVPTLDSIRRFMSAADQAALWQRPDAHQYHLNYESTAGEHVGYAFGTLFNFDQALANRYGAWSGLDQYVLQAQVQNYESVRSQFEAFLDHSRNPPTPSTGTVYWQLNKGWPTLLWDLYNSDYDLAGSYFGARKANERLHALLAYDDGSVAVTNLTGITQPDVSVESRVRALDGRTLDDQVANGISLPSQGVATAVIAPRVPAATVPPTPAGAYFVELVVRQRGQVVDRSVYWLSTQRDVVDWTDSQGNPQALTGPTTSGQPQWADLRALRGLPAARVEAVAGTETRDGTAVTRVRVTNTSPAVAFFLRADVRRGVGGRPLGGDDQVLPITWSDDDVTLWPGQSQVLTATYRASLLAGASPVVTLSGWNVPASSVPGAGGDAASVPAGLEDLGTADGTPLVQGEPAPGPVTGAAPAPAAATPAGSHVAWTLRSLARAPLAQGDAADAIAVTLTNSGTAATDGTTPVTLTDVVDPDLGLVSIAGPGWTCDTSNAPTLTCAETGGPGGGPAVLAPGRSYPPLTLTVRVPDLAGFGTQDSTAGLHATNAVSAAGGEASLPRAAIAAEAPVAGRPVLTADDALASAFRQGDPAARYEITVIDQGGAPTSGGAASPIVATVSVPAGETAVALYGSGWRCSLTAIATPYRLPPSSCYRTDVLLGQNGEAAPITLLVAVRPDAPARVTQSVTVSGGGETAAPATVQAPTAIEAAAAAPSGPAGPLSVTSTHARAFAQGDAGDRYTLTVRGSGAAATTGTVTVVDTLPPGLTATRMTGPGWTCGLQAPAPPAPPDLFEPRAACSRSDPLAPGAAYPPITLTAAVAGDTRPAVTNAVTVSAGGPAGGSATSTDPTAVRQRADLRVAASPFGGGTPYAPFGRGGDAAGQDGYTVDVTNAGFAPTAGAVAMTAALPSGVRAVSLSGPAGWSCDAATATCATGPGTVLPAGGQALLTLRVAVSSTAPTDVLASFQVSGGGEIDQSDDAFVSPAMVRLGTG